jgi:hypothetical protein
MSYPDKPDDFEDACGPIEVEEGVGVGERFDFRVPASLVCIMDAECYPMCFVAPDKADAVAILLNEAMEARAKARDESTNGRRGE